jgi:hypothetical protein
VLNNDSVTAILLALASGHTDRAINVVATSDEIDEEERKVLWGALGEGGSRSEMARRFGDAMRSLGADRPLVNECYRVAFYAGEAWKTLSNNALFAYFGANRAGNPIDKWVHYFPIYDRHLGPFRDRPIRVLEIGVYRGGGLELLRHYLGPAAGLVGIDIDPVAVSAAGDRYPIELGDQANPDFLRRVAEAHGPFDVVIDDGGHTMQQQIVSIETLFPILNDGGTYLVEDTHTSFWKEYGPEAPDGLTFLDWARARIDDLHAYHTSTAMVLDEPWQTHLDSIHVYDSVVVFDKARREAPFSEVSGTIEFINYGREISALNLEMLATRDAALAKSAEDENRLGEELRVVRGELVDARQTAGQLHSELAQARDELAEMNASLHGSWQLLREMRRSRSWQITAPLRWVKSLLGRR